MISFRKHAAQRTRRPNLFLASSAQGTKAIGLLVLLLIAQAGVTAAPGPHQHKGRATQPDEKGRAAQADKPAKDGRVPIHVKRIETPDGPGVVATIGEFPEDLNEVGQEFLKAEFFEHFASDVLGLDESVPGATLKVAMLPQEKENQRECDFTVGKVAGHIVVLVEKRRVLVACTFSEVERGPQLLAGREGKRPRTRA